MTVPSEQPQLHIHQVATAMDWETALAVRTQVFVVEQGVPADLERDEIDGRAYHVLAVQNGQPVGTARAFGDAFDARQAWIGRMAVVARARGQGVASAMLRHLLDWCHLKGFRRVRLHAQSYIQPLYRKFGFHPLGQEFIEAGILHTEMILDLPAPSVTPEG